MLNLLHAQFYRLVRSVTFWGFLGVTLFVSGLGVWSFGMSYDSAVAYDTGVGFLLPGTTLWLRPEDYAGQMAAMFVPLLSSLFVARFFVDDFSAGGSRILDAGPRFRRDYVLSSLVLIAVVAACLSVASLAAPLLVTPFFPLLDVQWGNFGCTVRWVLQMVLAVLIYGALTLAVTAATGRLGLSVLVAFLLGIGLVDSWMVDAVEAVRGVLFGVGVGDGFSWGQLTLYQDPQGFAWWLPSGQVWGVLAHGYTPTVLGIVPLAALAAIAGLLCWLAIRRKRI
ncbi:ABC transporter permease [uncultured Adlercreutzia sp.]|uniref:ABC transporter permease n=1 Tax=uncultured Adlercreutzia sp. TaxID=875803 RepID=UPI0026F38B15|nr:ABC transporter permease [uncultured Adlercreutzia sp.]